jgi:hypothetical protein
VSVVDLTDEEAIATAMLLGCTFFQRDEEGFGDWFVDNSSVDHWHPVERARYDNRANRAQVWGWPSRAELARDYIDWSIRNGR